MSDGFVQFTLNDENETIIKVPYLMEDTLVFVSEKPGDVQTKLTNQQKRSVVHLIVKGAVDASDVRYIADQMLALEILDMRETNLIEVPAYAFCKGKLKYGKETIREVYLPETCLSIGEYAFYGCVNLKILEASNVTDLGNEALQYCHMKKMIAKLGGSIEKINNCTIERFEYGVNATRANTFADIIVDTVFCHTGIMSIGTFNQYYKNVIFEEPANIEIIEDGDFLNHKSNQFVLPTSVKILEACSFHSSEIELFIIPSNSQLSKIESNSWGDGPFGAYKSWNEIAQVSILCYLETPISIGCFFRSHEKSAGNLYVPKTSVELYKASAWGADFTNIVAIENSEYANWGL